MDVTDLAKFLSWEIMQLEYHEVSDQGVLEEKIKELLEEYFQK